MLVYSRINLSHLLVRNHTMPLNKTSENPIRVRFAPSPTGIMHLGNVRAALMNYLFAIKHTGEFILRIEDTDQERNAPEYTAQILQDLTWLMLDNFQGPYFQSERTALYEEYLALFKEKNSVYRCFCSVQELEKKRQRQLALKLPPRYDRTCLKLSVEQQEEMLANKIPFIWRFALPSDSIEIYDLARGTITFDLKNFSDFSLTRPNGSFTFMFANFVDDLTMKITQVVRGEDHLTNTAGQAALYRTLGAPMPIFWHLPIMVNTEGKKLSKRDFGFSLNDLRDGGFLPQAICNYLACIGGSAIQEIAPLATLAHHLNTDEIKSSGQITYDVEKLRWINHQWLRSLSAEQVTELVTPFLRSAYQEKDFPHKEKLTLLLSVIKDELFTLQEAVPALAFYFIRPTVSLTELEELELTQTAALVRPLFAQQTELLDLAHVIQAGQDAVKTAGIPVKKFFMLVRLALTGKTEGIGIKDLCTMLDSAEAISRLKSF
jgi:glutamyl-tRNA synthetase